jgi:hypothetical protein
MIYYMETMAREIELEKKRTGRLITQQTCIFDVAELSMRVLSHKPSNLLYPLIYYFQISADY